MNSIHKKLIELSVAYHKADDLHNSIAGFEIPEVQKENFSNIIIVY